MAEEENTKRLRANLQNLFCDWRTPQRPVAISTGRKLLMENLKCLVILEWQNASIPFSFFFYVLVRPGCKAAASIRCRWGTKPRARKKLQYKHSMQELDGIGSNRIDASFIDWSVGVEKRFHYQRCVLSEVLRQPLLKLQSAVFIPGHHPELITEISGVAASPGQSH